MSARQNLLLTLCAAELHVIDSHFFTRDRRVRRLSAEWGLDSATRGKRSPTLATVQSLPAAPLHSSQLIFYRLTPPAAMGPHDRWQ